MSCCGGSHATHHSSPAVAASSDMDLDMDMDDGSCKISMLWNWDTVGACFISPQWQVTNDGYFAGTCIGVICLVMCLPILRLLHQRYDGYLLNKHVDAGSSGRPGFFQQGFRALLYTAQFTVAYFVMLMAMYYNGYIIISILIGAFFGYFIFSWPKFNQVHVFKEGRNPVTEEGGTEVTGCCG